MMIKQKTEPLFSSISIVLLAITFILAYISSAYAQTKTEKEIISSLAGIRFSEKSLSNIKDSSSLSDLGFDYVISQKADKYRFDKTGAYIKVDGVYNKELRTAENINDIVLLSPNSYAFSISGLLTDDNGNDAWIILNYYKSSYMEKASGEKNSGSSNNDIRDAVSFFFDGIKDDLSFSNIADKANKELKYLLLTDSNIGILAREIGSQSKNYFEKSYSLTAAFPQYDSSLSSVYTFNTTGPFISVCTDAEAKFPESGINIGALDSSTIQCCAIRYEYTKDNGSPRWVICDFTNDEELASSETVCRKSFEKIEREYIKEFKDVTDEEIDSGEIETEGYHTAMDKVKISDESDDEGKTASYSPDSGTLITYDSRIMSLDKDPLSYVKDLEISKDPSSLSAGEKELQGTAASFYEFVQAAAVIGMLLTFGICAVKLSVYGSRAKPDVEQTLLTKCAAFIAIFGITGLWALFVPVLKELL